jgi:branched-chain amino acid aminotransferase
MAMNNSNPQYAYFKGQIVPIAQAQVSVMTHALHYGTAVFGGLRGYWNAAHEQLYIFRPYDHFVRLKESANLLLMPLEESAEDLTKILAELLRTEGFRGDVYIRPLVYKAHEGIGVKLHDLEHELTMFAFPFGRYVDKEEGLALGTASWRRVDDTSIPARGKIAGSYVNGALAKTEAIQNGYDEAIVLNQDGHVSEASAANLFMLRRGVVITPPINANILEGITRHTVMTLLRDELGIQVVEREIDRTELYNAEEVFLCGTGVQVAAVTSVDRRKVGSGAMGEVVQQLRSVFFDVVRGENAHYAPWLHAVYAEAAVGAAAD